MSTIYRDDAISIAVNEIGYMEKASDYDLDSKTGNAGHGNFTKYARDLWNANPHFYQGPKNGYDWCCVFVDWCIYNACGWDSEYAQKVKYYTGPYGAGCEFAAQYYKAANAWYLIPKPGDQIFFGYNGSFQHTGIVERIAGDVIYTIEGNSKDEVRRCSYVKTDSYILGYGRPKYDGDTRPSDHPFVDVPSDAWYSDAVQWAFENGITAGTDNTHFSPDKACTRAEVIQMLYKMNLDQ